jgi:hypothetical protein
MDIVFITLATGLWLAIWGLTTVCGRLLPKESRQ